MNGLAMSGCPRLDYPSIEASSWSAWSTPGCSITSPRKISGVSSRWLTVSTGDDGDDGDDDVMMIEMVMATTFNVVLLGVMLQFRSQMFLFSADVMLFPLNWWSSLMSLNFDIWQTLSIKY